MRKFLKKVRKVQRLVDRGASFSKIRRALRRAVRHAKKALRRARRAVRRHRRHHHHHRRHHHHHRGHHHHHHHGHHRHHVSWRTVSVKRFKITKIPAFAGWRHKKRIARQNARVVLKVLASHARPVVKARIIGKAIKSQRVWTLELRLKIINAKSAKKRAKFSKMHANAFRTLVAYRGMRKAIVHKKWGFLRRMVFRVKTFFRRVFNIRRRR